MEKQNKLKVNKLYLISVLLFMLILPIIFVLIYWGNIGGPIVLIGKWFVFWGLGIRLLTAGLKQAIQPAFTAKEILKIDNPESQIIVRELGFANICIGITGVLSIFLPGWTSAVALAGGLYMGIAGVMHIVKKPSTPNEVIAMISDVFIFLVLSSYLYVFFSNAIVLF